jgi:hypothetical protein
MRRRVTAVEADRLLVVLLGSRIILRPHITRALYYIDFEILVVYLLRLVDLLKRLLEITSP